MCIFKRRKRKKELSPFMMYKIDTKPGKIPRDVSILAAYKYGKKE